jgi:hypothetical protein
MASSEDSKSSLSVTLLDVRTDGEPAYLLHR